MFRNVRHRFHGGTVLLGFLLVLLTVSSMLIGMNRNGKRELEKLSRGFYTEDKTKVDVEGVKEEGAVMDFLGRQMQGDGAGIVFRIGLEAGQDVRGVCYWGDISLPEVESGRFFSEKDCLSEKPLALVGRNYQREIKKKGKEKYIAIGQREYQVMGILGSGEESRFDEMRLINMGAASVAYGQNGQYIFDGKNRDAISGQAGEFAAWMEEQADQVYWDGAETLGFDSPEEVQAREDDEKRDGMAGIYLSMIVSFLLSSLSGVFFWFRHREAGRQVEELLGAGGLRIILETCGAFLGLWLFAFLTGQGIVFLLRLWCIPYAAYPADYLMAAGITLLPGGFLNTLSIFRTLFWRVGLPRVPSLISFHDVILMFQFICFFWLFCQISTYYIDINGNPWVENAKNGYQYYTLHEDWDEADAGDDPAMIDSIKKVLAGLEKGQDFTFMTIDRGQIYDMDLGMARKKFGSDDWGDFLSGSLYPGYYKEFPEYKKNMEEMNEGSIPLSLTRMDRNGVEHYVKRAGEGRIFSESDYRLEMHGENVPVMMGAAYRKYFRLGETFSVPMAGGRTLEAEVIGFVPENTRYVSDATLEHMGSDTDQLDYTIILPYFDIQGTPTSREDEIFLQENYYNRLQGTLVFEEGASDREVLKAQAWINELYLANGLYTCTVINATEGIKLFMRETRKSVGIITFLMAVMAVSSVISLCVSLVNKLQRNLYRYGVQLMNGQSPWKIFLSYMGEIFFVMLMAAMCVAYQIFGLIWDNIQFLWLLLFGALLAMLPCAAVMAVKLQGVDMELLLRRKE